MALDDNQVKVLEVLASGAMNATAILFTVVTVLVGVVFSSEKRSEAREFRLAVIAAVIAVLLALAFSVAAILALSYRNGALYTVVVGFGWFTVVALGLAALFLGRAAVAR